MRIRPGRRQRVRIFPARLGDEWPDRYCPLYRPAVAVLRRLLPGRLEAQPEADVNLGLRWETTLPPVEELDRWSDFSPTTPEPGRR